MNTLPKIEKEIIKNNCGARMYQIGKDFLKEEPFFVYFREWTMLKALSEGTESPSYAVRILLDDTGIASSCCTCYVNRSVLFLKDQFGQVIFEKCQKMRL